MELHFCSVCGYSIPNSEVDSGAARGADDKLVCSEHRGSAEGGASKQAAASNTAVSGKSGKSAQTASDDDVELLFCANCRVSIPLPDYRSGRARREYGSLLCGVCVKSDPGTRAARRDAVEAEMAADVEANDPVQTHRCAICSAAVPHSHIVTGKASLNGDRVTCEGCRAASIGSGGGFVKTFALVCVVAAVAGTIGYVVGPLMMGQQEDRVAPLQQRIAQLEAKLDTQLASPVDTGADDRVKLAEELASVRRLLDEDLRGDVAALRNEMAGVRREFAREDARSDKRLTRLEGQIDEIVKNLTNAPREAPPQKEIRIDPPPVEPPVVDEPPMDGGDPTVPEVDPVVTRLCKDLLESPEDGVRFPAANELGRLKDEAAIPALADALVNDKHFLVRRACARSLNMLKAWYASPALIDALEDKEAYVAQQANFALRSITGQDFQVTQEQSPSERKRRAKKARKWWDANGESPPEGVSLHSAELVR